MAYQSANIPRGLSEEEAAAWAKLAQSVTPFAGRKAAPIPREGATKAPLKRSKSAPETFARSLETSRDVPRKPVVRLNHQESNAGLDGSWEKTLRSGNVAPDVTLDLHGHNLDSAYQRLEAGLAQAVAMDARVVLLIAGKPRPAQPADRGDRRGAIRAKVLDWLAAGPHASCIAAIRKAHRRHGGEGALYLVLRRRRVTGR